MQKVLDKLLIYNRVHFTTEEFYFKQFNYPETEEHIKEHKSFILKIQELRTQAGENAGKFIFSLISYLQEWITKHICEVDKKYVSCFKKNMVF